MNARLARLRAASGALDRDQRFAALAALTLLVTMFLPWYEKAFFIKSTGKPAHDSISAFGAVSFVEAAIFLVSAGVLVLVLARAEGGKFHLPGGDGTVIFAAGLWASALIFYRVFDRPDISGDGGTVGIQWGFFVAFVCAGALAVAGQRMRVAARALAPVREPRRSRVPPPAAAPPQVPPSGGDVVEEYVPASGETSAAGEPEWQEPHPAEAGTQVVPASEARTEVGPAQPRPPRDRAVRREDAEELSFEAPESIEPPPPTRRMPRSRDHR